MYENSSRRGRRQTIDYRTYQTIPSHVKIRRAEARRLRHCILSPSDFVWNDSAEGSSQGLDVRYLRLIHRLEVRAMDIPAYITSSTYALVKIGFVFFLSLHPYFWLRVVGTLEIKTQIGAMTPKLLMVPAPSCTRHSKRSVTHWMELLIRSFSLSDFIVVLL